ncbi:hypothetical protein [uncultured Oxalicibacterium sp.]|uniref:hypothetical protein n=1 Tax=uncultured Oxalicibacterium sp. TaxID=1168540 RepID=UPI0025FFE93A|nr:hypothetical protein [uncultured Oxalicibacterium sp.]
MIADVAARGAFLYNAAVKKDCWVENYIFGIETSDWNDKKDGHMPIFFLLSNLCCCQR